MKKAVRIQPRRWALAAATALLAVWAAQRLLAPTPVRVGPHAVPPGTGFGGEPLPPEHPLQHGRGFRALAHRDAGAPGPGAARPVELRRFCAWGQNAPAAFRGPLSEWLAVARVPAEARAELVTAVTHRAGLEPLRITNEAIEGLRSGRRFDAHALALASGRTLCLGSRINLLPQEQRAAWLYEAVGASGERFGLMLLGEDGAAALLRPLGGAARGPGGWSLDPVQPGRRAPDLDVAAVSGR